MRPNRRAVLLLLLLASALSACTLQTPAAETGNVTVALTDSPGFAFDNVWITVRAVWFHKVDTAPFDNTATGWVRFRLDIPMTLNLAALSGGTVRTVFDNLALPAGTYRQFLLFLEPTESAVTTSAAVNGLRFNNQVDAGSLHAALRVPNAGQGIRLAGPFQIDNAALLRLAVDFDIGHSVLPFNRGAVQEFILQPRLRTFDLDNAGAIVGFIDTAAAGDNTAFFEVLAEQVDTTLGGRVVRRAAAVDNATGRFVLYPLALGQYDLVVAGRRWETVVVTNVPANVRATPASGATAVGSAASPLQMFAGSDYTINAIMSPPGPAGAAANFYQTLSGTDIIPYLVKAGSFDPLAGRIDGFPLSAGSLHVGKFVSGGAAIPLQPNTPVGLNGAYTGLAAADLYLSGIAPNSPPNVNAAFSGQDFPFSPLAVNAPAGNAFGGNVAVPQPAVPLDNVFVFATHGGVIANSQILAPVITASTVPYTVLNLPGGTAGASFPLGTYAVGAYGWTVSASDNALRIGTSNAVVNLQAGTPAASFDLTIGKVTVP